MPFSKSTLKQRENFYKNKFNIKKVREFLPIQPQFFAIDAGTETKIAKNKKDIGKLLILKPNISYEELREKLIEHLPEDVYYDRNIYKNPENCPSNFKFSEAFHSDNFLGQELAFDIDPENIIKSRSIWSFNKDLIIKASEITLEFYNELKRNFNNVRIVYSGRGFHLHVLDKKAYKFSIYERKELTKRFEKYPIDSWVSRGFIELIRMPYSLNSLVSRRVIPVKNKFIKKEALPRFLKL